MIDRSIDRYYNCLEQNEVKKSTKYNFYIFSLILMIRVIIRVISIDDFF